MLARDDLFKGLKYHNQLTRLQEPDAKVRQQICERRAEMEAEDLEGSEQPGPLQYVTAAVHDVMAEFEDAVHHDKDVNVDEMIASLNADQLRVFNKVKLVIEDRTRSTSDTPAALLQMFISGCGGTGKSFLIKTIKAWVQLATVKDVAIAVPMGIATFNCNSLTIHRLLMLPVEHGKTLQYRPMSDDAL